MIHITSCTVGDFDYNKRSTTVSVLYILENTSILEGHNRIERYVNLGSATSFMSMLSLLYTMTSSVDGICMNR